MRTCIRYISYLVGSGSGYIIRSMFVLMTNVLCFAECISVCSRWLRSWRNNRQPRTCDFVLWTFKNNASTDYILECIYIDIFNMHTQQGVPMSTPSIYAKCVGNGWCNVVSLQGLSWFAGRRQKIQKNGVFVLIQGFSSCVLGLKFVLVIAPCTQCV